MRIRRFGIAAVACAALLVTAGPATVASASTTTKPFSLVVSPPTVGAGDPVTFTQTITNESNPQTLGSADISIANPTGFVLTGASIASSSVSLPTATASLSGQSVLVRGLSLPPGQWVSVAVTGYAPCADESNTWAVIAKQANDFSGSPGNDFYLDVANSQLALSTTGSCSLAFQTQPAAAAVNTAITSTAFNNPAGSPIEVGIFDASGSLITATAAPASSATVTMALGTNPTGATLSPSNGLSVAAVGGIATFSGLEINLPTLTTGYTLSATSSVAPPPAVPSASFDIWQSETNCTSGKSCQVSASAPGGSSQISGTPQSSGATLEASLDVQSYSCGDTYYHAPFGTTVDSSGFTATTKTATVTIAKSAVLGPASQYEVCYQSSTSFVDQAGNTVNLGLLPTCKKNGDMAPCVTSISKDKSGAIVESLLLPGSDPYFR